MGKVGTAWGSCPGEAGTDWATECEGSQGTLWNNTGSGILTTVPYPYEATEQLQLNDDFSSQRLLLFDPMQVMESAEIQEIRVYQTLFESEHTQPPDDYFIESAEITDIQVYQDFFPREHTQPPDDYFIESAEITSIQVILGPNNIQHIQPPEDFIQEGADINAITVVEI